MTSPAQKAAGEIAKLLTGRDDTPLGLPTSIIQSAITEAVDAAVAPKEKRVKELEAALTKIARSCEDGADLSCEEVLGDISETATAALEAPHEPR